MNLNPIAFALAASFSLVSLPTYANTDTEIQTGADTQVIESTTSVPEYVISDAEQAQIEAYYNDNQTDSLSGLVNGLVETFPSIPEPNLVVALLDLLPEVPSADFVIAGLLELFPDLSIEDIVASVLTAMPDQQETIVLSAMTLAPEQAAEIARTAADMGVSAEVITLAAVSVPSVDIAAVTIAIEAQTAAGIPTPAAAAPTPTLNTFANRGNGVSPS
ncbi:hypothetical protein R3X26_00445 [Vibrio sp. TH_r3]|uniref:hypothetical protein n=1 Tax=Vibrio sp. TH_r3 TaxID=3082084 RepID=UPI00295364A5|nr:hypothetical protein [Vibrio sp. TH_r3]MDV7102870.1 hypothetical protein [Vibrio sp. TH_r3]